VIKAVAEEILKTLGIPSGKNMPGCGGMERVVAGEPRPLRALNEFERF